MSAVNALLETRLENDESFDVNAMLRTAERKLQLAPETTFFNCLAWQLAKSGKLPEFGCVDFACFVLVNAVFSPLTYEMSKRGVSAESEFLLAQIYGAERSGHEKKSAQLQRRFCSLNGAPANASTPINFALNAACAGAAAGGYVTRLKRLLTQAASGGGAEKENRSVLMLEPRILFGIIFSLAEISEDGQGKQHQAFVNEVRCTATFIFERAFADSRAGESAARLFQVFVRRGRAPH